MTICFETLADKANCGNMKESFCTLAAQKQGIMLSGAEIDYPTAPVIRRTLADFALRGSYGFTLADDPYFESIQWWMKKTRDYTVNKDEIVPTLGTIFALGTALRAFTAPGDGIILNHPVYYRFDRMIERCGRRVISNLLLESNGCYALDFADLEEKMAVPCNKMLVLCNPHNPTGKVFSESDLKKIAALSEKYNVIVFSDEIFGEVTFVGHAAIPFSEFSPKTALVSTSLGKSFSLTGVNHANVIIKDVTLREAYQTQRDIDHFGSIDPFFYMALRAGYSQDGYDWVQAMKAHTLANYNLMCDTFASKMPQLSLSPLEGTYIAWLDCRCLGLHGHELIEFMELNAKLWADPGEEYGPGGDGFYRLNIATPRSQIDTMLENLMGALTAPDKNYGG